MSDYKEAPSTEDEIEDMISEAKKAAKAQNPNKSGNKSKRNRNKNRNRNKTKAQDEESSENLFSEIDSVADAQEDDDENLSPKMKSAKSFSNAFAAAKEKREQALKAMRSEQEISDEEDEEEEEQNADTEDEEVEYEEYDEEESTEFDVDSEDEDYVEENLDGEEYDGIFDTDDENEEYIENVDVDEDDEDVIDNDDEDDDDDDEDDEDEDDDEAGAFSTKAKVIIGVIIAILVLAIIGAAVFFLSSGDKGGNNPGVTSQTPDGSVTGIHFAEPAISLRVGETLPLEIVVEPESAKDKVLKLKSNDPSIAKVDEQGKITGVSSGSTTVTATLKSNESIVASLIVNVIDDDQDAINIYNKFVNAIVDGSTDIDSDTDTDSEEEQQYDEFGNPIENTDSDSDSDSDSDTDTDTQQTIKPKDVLTGNIIKDLDEDGNLELALYYKGEQDNSKVRIFRLADPNEEEEETVEEEPQYDEFGNLIEPEDTDTETDTDTEAKSGTAPSEKVLTEIPEETELYTKCYGTIETDGTSWNTSYIEIKEEETGTAKVTILSSGYSSPSYTYEVEDQTICTVDNQGTIKAIKPGTTYVTVTSSLNSDAMAKIKVRVKDDTDLLDDYLANVPLVHETNDAVFPTETLTGKAIVDIDNDGVSELLLRFDYGEHVQAINMVKVENEQCVVYKTYNNLSDLYEYNEGAGYYNNSILVHYTSGKVCMEYKGVVAKEDSKTRTTEQKILSVESGGSLSELINLRTTTDITTKTVTSEVEIEPEEDTSYEDNTEVIDSDSDVWYDDTDSDYTNEYDDNTGYEDGNDGEDDDYDYNYEASYAEFTFDELVAAEDNGIDLSVKKAEKKLPEAAAAPEDEDDGDDDDEPVSSTTPSRDEEPRSRITSTVTSEISEETTKYFVNGTPVEQSVYEEMLASYSARYSVWSAWESV